MGVHTPRVIRVIAGVIRVVCIDAAGDRVIRGELELVDAGLVTVPTVLASTGLTFTYIYIYS